MELETETIFVRIATKEASTTTPPSNAPAARASDRVGEFAGARKPPTVKLLTMSEQRISTLWVYTIFPILAHGRNYLPAMGFLRLQLHRQWFEIPGLLAVFGDGAVG